MKNNLYKYFKLFFFTLFVVQLSNAKAQTSEEVVSYFVKDQLEVTQGKTAFNVFKIENHTNKNQSIQVNFTLPPNWTAFGERTYYIDLKPNQTTSIPLRLTPSSSAKGGVGYALNATLISNVGEIFATKYCFLTVPEKTVINAKFTSYSYYLDHLFGKSDIGVYVKNDGNSNKNMQLTITSDPKTKFIGGFSNINLCELNLSPGQDTLLKYGLIYNDNIDNINYFKKVLSLQIKTNDTLIERFSFLNYLDWRYENPLELENMPLVIEVSALDLLGDDILFRILAYGKLLLKKHRSISYYYRSISAPISKLPNYKEDEYYIKYKTPKNEFMVGNIRDMHELSYFGPGASYKQKFGNKTQIELLGMQDNYSLSYTGIVSAQTKIRNNIIYAEYIKNVDDTTYNTIFDRYGIGIKMSPKINTQIDLSGYQTLYNLTDKTGNAIKARFFTNMNRYSVSINLRHASPYYAAYYHGRTELYSSVIYKLNQKSSLNAGYNYFKIKPASIYNDYSEDLNLNYHSIKLLYQYQIKSDSRIYFGPNYDLGQKNYLGTQKISPLVIQIPKAELGYAYSPNLSSLRSATINLQMGYVSPIKYTDTIASDYTKSSAMIKLTATVMGKNWGFIGMYYSGDYNISTALTSFYSTSIGKNLYAMPYYRLESSNKKFYYEIRLSYLNNIDIKTVRTSLIQEAGGDFGRGWSARLQNNTNMQTLTDGSGQIYRYTNNYMEITLRKVFNWNHPGQKYHSLKTVFYRDYDGNRIKGANEAGVENVVQTIVNMIGVDTSYHYDGELFGNIDLASNQEGTTLYERIPAAAYRLKFYPTEENSTFSLLQQEMDIDLKKDTTIYVPFVERNKVYGTVKFNYSKRSGFTDIDVDNIRINIIDSHGNSQYTLTDKNGYYEFYAPASDFYTVQIANNLWRDYFELKQDKYIIKFNGYKTFEVNFEFEEKKREIHFDDVLEVDNLEDNTDNFEYEDVAQIKQTIVRGIVKDDESLEPIKAIVEIWDVNRHDVLEKVYTNERSGNFYTVFKAGNGLQLRIHAPGYWYFTENLPNNQLSTFETIDYDGLMLRKIIVGQKLDLRNLVFDANSQQLSIEAKTELESTIVLLTNNENVNVKLNGYYDDGEKDGNNLAMARAKAVFEFLVSRGIDASRLSVENKGKGKFSTRNNTAQQNRRVEIEVSKAK